jgi:hypothetical protein
MRKLGHSTQIKKRKLGHHLVQGLVVGIHKLYIKKSPKIVQYIILRKDDMLRPISSI